MKGLPFQLEIIEADTNWIVSCASECGEALIRVAAPYSETELQSALSRVELSLAKSYSSLPVRGAPATERPVREFGERLTQTVFQNDISTQFDLCRREARRQGAPVRILLRTNGPHVASIPWEYLVDPSRDDYLALRVPIVRYLRLMNPAPPLPLTLPLRVLGITANPATFPCWMENGRRGRYHRRSHGTAPRTWTSTGCPVTNGRIWRESCGLAPGTFCTASATADSMRKGMPDTFSCPVPMGLPKNICQ